MSTVVVETAARLHFGVLDLRGSLGRWFGGIGAAAPGPTMRVSARPADELRVDGEDADRALEFAERFQRHFDLDAAVHVHVERALPRHKGLGSGTQLALAVGRALADVLRSEDAHFSNVWESAPAHQRILLQALALEEGHPFATEYRRRHGLPGTSSIQRALQALDRAELVSRTNGRARISEPFLAQWLRWKIR